MNVSELIAKLQTLPPNLRVVIDGYEGGLCDIEEEDNFDVFPIKLNVNDSSWDGPHDLVWRDNPYDEMAVYICR